MKRQIALVTAAVTLGLSGTAFATHNPNHNPPVPKKVTICHATSSVQNQWVRTVVSENATAGHFDNNGNPDKGHEGDVLLQGDVACPPVVVTPVVDLCENIEGNQAVVPVGKVQKDKICVDEATTAPEVVVETPKVETKTSTTTQVTTPAVESAPVEYPTFQGK